jgi:hypothetical protein
MSSKDLPEKRERPRSLKLKRDFIQFVENCTRAKYVALWTIFLVSVFELENLRCYISRSAATGIMILLYIYLGG